MKTFRNISVLLAVLASSLLLSSAVAETSNTVLTAPFPSARMCYERADISGSHSHCAYDPPRFSDPHSMLVKGTATNGDLLVGGLSKIPTGTTALPRHLHTGYVYLSAASARFASNPAGGLVTVSAEIVQLFRVADPAKDDLLVCMRLMDGSDEVDLDCLSLDSATGTLNVQASVAGGKSVTAEVFARGGNSFTQAFAGAAHLKLKTLAYTV